NDYAIWRGFDNQYWPALYFVDGHGAVRHGQFGEGSYDMAEMTIQRLLSEAGATGIVRELVRVDPQGIEAAADWDSLGSPENYLGTDRTEHFVSGIPTRLNEWSVAGDWSRGKKALTLNAPNGRILYRFHARDVNLVMGPAAKGTSIRYRVRIDGQPPGNGHGGDVDVQGQGAVTEQRLYQLIRQTPPIADRQFEIEFLDPRVEAFAFTFG
ncbi:MAG TPA: hypothetical protein VKB45_12305, partial [Gemmatimonadales bacterium]|nr:hypothetical protein [Gemmatimonadales bacterium]